MSLEPVTEGPELERNQPAPFQGFEWDPAKHPRGLDGRFSSLGGLARKLERSWDGFPFDARTGQGPKALDVPPERTPEGDFVVYHGSSRATARKIMQERTLRPDDIGRVGITTVPGDARTYGYLHRQGGPATVVQMVIDKNWLGQQLIEREYGGRGANQFLIRPPHGSAFGTKMTVPPEAIKGMVMMAELAVFEGADFRNEPAPFDPDLRFAFFRRAVRTVAAEPLHFAHFDPKELRDPATGRWMRVGGVVKAVKKALGPGSKVVYSDPAARLQHGVVAEKKGRNITVVSPSAAAVAIASSHGRRSDTEVLKSLARSGSALTFDQSGVMDEAQMSAQTAAVHRKMAAQIEKEVELGVRHPREIAAVDLHRAVAKELDKGTKITKAKAEAKDPLAVVRAGGAPLNAARIAACETEERPENADAVEANISKLAGNSKPVVRVPSDVVAPILRSGRLKSQFETETSMGLMDPSERADAEQEMFGLPQDTPPKLRPIYAYMDEDPTHPEDPDSDVSSYGDVKIVLKDSVRNRTTITCTDSLQPQYDDPIYPGATVRAPSKLTDPKWYSEAEEPGSFGGSDPAKWETLTPGEMGPPLYVEAQVHGGVSMKDVEYMRVPPESEGNDALMKAGWQPVMPQVETTAASQEDDSTILWYPPGASLPAGGLGVKVPGGEGVIAGTDPESGDILVRMPDGSSAWYDRDQVTNLAGEALLGAEWEEKLHPRWPKGTPGKGGKFMDKGEIASILKGLAGGFKPGDTAEGETGGRWEIVGPGSTAETVTAKSLRSGTIYRDVEASRLKKVEKPAGLPGGFKVGDKVTREGGGDWEVTGAGKATGTLRAKSGEGEIVEARPESFTKLAPARRSKKLTTGDRVVWDEPVAPDDPAMKQHHGVVTGTTVSGRSVTVREDGYVVERDVLTSRASHEVAAPPAAPKPRASTDYRKGDKVLYADPDSGRLKHGVVQSVKTTPEAWPGEGPMKVASVQIEDRPKGSALLPGLLSPGDIVTTAHGARLTVLGKGKRGGMKVQVKDEHGAIFDADGSTLTKVGAETPTIDIHTEGLLPESALSRMTPKDRREMAGIIRGEVRDGKRPATSYLAATLQESIADELDQQSMGGNALDIARNGGAPLNARRVAAAEANRPKNADAIAANLARCAANSQPVVRAPAGCLEAILNTGRLKSQFETHRSSGALNNDLRASAESEMFGYPTDMPDELRPIYGYMDEDITHPEASYAAGWYGDVKIVLKPSVRDRTTITLEDSLQPTYDDPINDWNGGRARSPAKLTDPQWYAGTPYQKEQPQKWVTMSPVGAPAAEMKGPEQYVEAQIHGGVTMDDVDYMRVARGGQSARILKRAGWQEAVPVHETEDMGDTVIFYPPGAAIDPTVATPGQARRVLVTRFNTGKLTDFQPGDYVYGGSGAGRVDEVSAEHKPDPPFADAWPAGAVHVVFDSGQGTWLPPEFVTHDVPKMTPPRKLITTPGTAIGSDFQTGDHVIWHGDAATIEQISHTGDITDLYIRFEDGQALTVDPKDVIHDEAKMTGVPPLPTAEEAGPGAASAATAASLEAAKGIRIGDPGFVPDPAFPPPEPGSAVGHYALGKVVAKNPDGTIEVELTDGRRVVVPATELSA